MTRSALATTALVTAAACAQPTPPPAAPLSAAAPAPAAPTSAGALPPAPGGAGSVRGTVATNPYHAIRGGGVVYVEDAPRQPGAPKSATLDNHDMEFVPSIVVVPAGGSVIFTNTDPVMHNVFTPDGDKWNLGEIPQNASVVRRFDAPGKYTILCNLHQNMIAHLLVTPSGYYARTDADGAYLLQGLPPGTYRVTAWVPRLEPATQTVAVNSGEVTANFELRR